MAHLALNRHRCAGWGYGGWRGRSAHHGVESLAPPMPRPINLNLAPLEKVDHSPMTCQVLVENIVLRRAQSGNQYLDWCLAITSEPHRGRTLRMITSLSPQARRHLWPVLRSFGVKDPEVKFEFDDETMELTSPDLVGRPARAFVKNDNYNGEPQTLVDKLFGT